MLGIPDVAGAAVGGWAFEPPCHEPGYPDHPPTFPNQGNCTGDWTHNITMYDYLRVPSCLRMCQLDGQGLKKNLVLQGQLYPSLSACWGQASSHSHPVLLCAVT